MILYNQQKAGTHKQHALHALNRGQKIYEVTNTCLIERYDT